MADFVDAFFEIGAVGFCGHPLRLRGRGVEPATGQIRRREIVVACKDRRAVLCPACARVYQGDAWQIVASGLRGGKGVPDTVVSHPTLFATVTAPSFGPVHSRPGGSSASRPCRPRRDEPHCVHGRPAFCELRHGPDDPALGRPLCRECFDYEGAVLWNASTGALWHRTATNLYQSIGDVVGRSRAAVRRHARVSYVKVAEFQRRGLIHFHLVMRADGASGPDETPPEWLVADVLAEALRMSVKRTTVTALDGRTIRWGSELEVHAIEDGDRRSAVASYVAKYAVKTATELPALARPIRGLETLERSGVDDHCAELVRVAWRLGDDPRFEDLALRRHAHTFGYRGHVGTKSLRYSTTFAALRDARRQFVQGEQLAGFDARWEFVGRGYDSQPAQHLAHALGRERSELERTRSESGR